MTTNTPIKINDKERKVLEILADAYHPDEWGAYAFASLSRQTKLEVKEVRRACRSLAKKGLAKYERVLWNEDTGPAGAGYRATEEGAAFIDPCDICGGRISYDYTIDANGKHDWEKGYDEKTGRHIRECNEHYKQSAARPQQTTLA